VVSPEDKTPQIIDLVDEIAEGIFNVDGEIWFAVHRTPHRRDNHRVHHASDFQVVYSIYEEKSRIINKLSTPAQSH